MREMTQGCGEVKVGGVRGTYRRTRGFIEKINKAGERPGARDVLIHEGEGGLTI